MLERAHLAVILVLMAIAAVIMGRRIAWAWRSVDCKHNRSLRRYWLPRKRYRVICQDCHRIVAKGRDRYHVKRKASRAPGDASPVPGGGA